MAGKEKAQENEAKRVLAGLHGNEIVGVSSFGSNAESAPEPTFFKLSSPGLFPTDRQVSDHLVKVKVQIMEEIHHRLFESAPTDTTRDKRLAGKDLPKLEQTDLIGEIRRAGAALASKKGECTDLRLFIVSDMIEQSATVDLTSANLETVNRKSILESVKSLRGLPSLSGVQVWALGAGRDSQAVISSRRLELIEKFWQEFVKASGGQLPDGQYGQSVEW